MAKVVKVFEISEVSLGDSVREVPSTAGAKLVTETDTQTLTNKTLTSPTVTGPVTTGEVVNATAATLSISAATHAGRIVTLNRAAGITVTMPAATGSGNRYRFIVGTTVTSNQYRFDVTGNDAYFGNIFGAQDGGATVEAWEAAADSDRIDLDGSTKGGIKGDYLEFVDIATDTWFVCGKIAQTGTQATPFTTGAVS